MNPVDVLPSLLSLAIALAGFSGVVAALQKQSNWSSNADVLFDALLGGTFFSACMSIFAMLLHSSPIPSNTSWAITSFVHAVLLLLVIAIRLTQILRGDAERTKVMVFTGISFVVLILIQLLNAFAFRQAWICVSVLAFYAFYGFGWFVLLLAEIRSNGNG